MLGLIAALAARAADIDPCAAVRTALLGADQQTRVQVHARTVAGRHPAGYTVADSWLIDAQQWLYIEGRLESHGPALHADGTRGLANGSASIGPAEQCEQIGESERDGRAVIGYDYQVPVEVGLNRVTLWVDRATGLPVSASITGPQWLMGRVLSRPGTPPQVKPRRDGRRYTEQIDFRFGDEVPPPGRLVGQPVR